MTADELHAVYGLLPYTAQVLIDILGATHALALLDARGGCTVRIPKHADRHPEGARRWAELAEIIGEPGMQALAQRWGGDYLDVPKCDEARRELRDRQIRAEFDRLTMGEGKSGKQAVYEIGLQIRPVLTYRQIEKICGKGDAEAAGGQGSLF